MHNLIIVEGPDGAGKSTLIAALHRSLPAAHLIHHGPMPEVFDLPAVYHRSMVEHPGLTIIDRAWVSERIYGTVCRGVNRVSFGDRRMLEQKALSLGALEVLCLPSLKDCMKTWRQREEYIKDERQFMTIYGKYAVYNAVLSSPLPRIQYNYSIQNIDAVVARIRRKIEV